MKPKNLLTYKEVIEAQQKGELGKIPCLEFRVQRQDFEKREKVRIPIQKRNGVYICVINSKYKRQNADCTQGDGCPLFHDESNLEETPLAPLVETEHGTATFKKLIQWTGDQFHVNIPKLAIRDLGLKRGDVVKVSITRISVDPAEVRWRKNYELAGSVQRT